MPPWQNADVQPCGTRAAYRRHLRHGEPACAACLEAESQRRPGAPRAVFGRREVRNGLPFKPYVYRGTGEDIYEDVS